MEEELREKLGEKYPKLEKFLENKKLGGCDSSIFI